MAEEWTRWDRQRLLWSTPGLRAREMRVLGCLLDHAGDDGLSWPSSARVAGLLGMRSDDVRKQIQSLVSKGLIVPNGKVRMVNRYEVCPRTVGVQQPRGCTTPGSSNPGAARPRGSGSSDPGKSGSSDPTELPKELPKELTTTDSAREPLTLSGSAPEPKPLTAKVDALWADFNQARNKTIGTELRTLSEKRRDCAEKALACWKGLSVAEVRVLGRRAIAHQFSDGFLRLRKVDSWESLCRHLESWAEKGERLESTPAAAVAAGPNTLAAARWAAARRAAMTGSTTP